MIKRRYGCDGVRAGFFRVSGKIAGDARSDRSDVRNDLLAVGDFDREFEKLFSLLLRQREALRGRTSDIYAVGALIENISFDLCERIVIDASVFVESGKQRYQNVSLFALDNYPSFYIKNFNISVL